MQQVFMQAGRYTLRVMGTTLIVIGTTGLVSVIGDAAKKGLSKVFKSKAETRTEKKEPAAAAA